MSIARMKPFDLHYNRNGLIVYVYIEVLAINIIKNECKLAELRIMYARKRNPFACK